MKTKMALFDFDKTIISRDSFNVLWRKTMKKSRNYSLYFTAHFLPGCVKMAKNVCYDHLKNVFMKMMDYYTPEELEDFVINELLPEYMYKEAQEEIFRLKEEGYYLLLVSASAMNYMKYVKKVLPFEGIIGTVLDENYCIVGGNNVREEKVRRIHKYLDKNNLEIDYENSRAYSDSLKNDGPMLKLVKHRYIINGNKVPEGYKLLHWNTALK